MPVRLFYWLVFLGAAGPGLQLGWRTWAGDLGVNPAETLLHESGRAGLLLLLASLSVTPLRRVTGWNRLPIVRRMLGLWAFAYAALHFLFYAAFNHLGDVKAIWADVVERPFIFSGMFAFAILLVLAVTSPVVMVRRLGRNWKALHRTVYLAAVAGVVHFAWGQKADIREPLLWGAGLFVLLAVRLAWALRDRRAKANSLIQ